MTGESGGWTARTSIPLAALGLVVGLVWWWVGPFQTSAHGPAPLQVASLFFASGFLLAGGFLWTGAAALRWARVAIALAALVAVPAWWVASLIPESNAPYSGDPQRLATWCAGAFAVLYIAVPFAQIHQVSGGLRFPYPELFRYSWSNFFVGCVALILVALLWAVLELWASLFAIVGVPLFRDTFHAPLFVYAVSFSAFGLGLGIGRANESVIGALRALSLGIGRTLLPLVSVLVLLFAVVLPWTGLAPLWKTGRATPIVLALLAMLAVFLNAVNEDCEGPAPARWLRVLCGAAVLMMPVYAAIALYSSWLRVGQYGLSPSRVWAICFGAIALCYSIGYALAAARRGTPWMGSIRAVNVAMAVVVGVIAILLHTPLLDPLRLSANNQVARLLRPGSDLDAFDYAALRFELGSYGWRELAFLGALKDHPQADAIHSAVAFVKKAPNVYEARRGGTHLLVPQDFEAIPSEPAVPEELVAFFQDNERALADACGSIRCLVIGVDLDADGIPEYCFVLTDQTPKSVCYAQIATHEWQRIGRLTLETRTADGLLVHGDFADQLRKEGVRTRPTRFLDLEVGGKVVRLVP
jgi:hypothetical protein